MSDGSPVGSKLGDTDGLILSSTDGVSDGLALGDGYGKPTSVPDGISVGAMTEALAVGLAFG